MARSPITLTEQAEAQIHVLLKGRGKPSAGIRIGVKSRGCSGLAYTFEFVDEVNPQDEVVKLKDLTIYIDSKALLYLLGMQIDYNDGDIESGFVFSNPNEKGRCGCGESFHI
jgi:iron-sulfur cluster assembly protein